MSTRAAGNEKISGHLNRPNASYTTVLPICCIITHATHPPEANNLEMLTDSQFARAC